MNSWKEKHRIGLMTALMLILAGLTIVLSYLKIQEKYEEQVKASAFLALEEEFDVKIEVVTADSYSSTIRCEGFGELSQDRQLAFFQKADMLEMYNIYGGGYGVSAFKDYPTDRKGLTVIDGEDSYCACDRSGYEIVKSEAEAQ